MQHGQVEKLKAQLGAQKLRAQRLLKAIKAQNKPGNEHGDKFVPWINPRPSNRLIAKLDNLIKNLQKDSETDTETKTDTETDTDTPTALAIVQKGNQIRCNSPVSDGVVERYHWEIRTKFQPWQPFRIYKNGNPRDINPNTANGCVRLIYKHTGVRIISNIISLDQVTRNLTANAKRDKWVFQDSDRYFLRKVHNHWCNIVHEVTKPSLLPQVPLHMQLLRDRIWGSKHRPSLFQKFNINVQQMGESKDDKIIHISNLSNSLIIFFESGVIIELNYLNGNIISNQKLKIDKITHLAFSSNYLILYHNNNKITLLTQ